MYLPRKLERNNYIEAMARKYQIAYEDLRKLVHKYGITMTTVQEPVVLEKKEKFKKKEEGIQQSQKILLTWLIEDVSLFDKIEGILSPEDFREELYHKVAKMLFEQYKEEGKVNPAKIINAFTDKDEQNEAASLFHGNLQENMSLKEKEKAWNETVIRIKKDSLDYRNRHATDILELQNIMKEQAILQKLHISLQDGAR